MWLICWICGVHTVSSGNVLHWADIYYNFIILGKLETRSRKEAGVILF